MARSKSVGKPSQFLPVAPWIYINDPSGTDRHASEIASLLPSVVHFKVHNVLAGSNSTSFIKMISDVKYHNTVIVVSDDKNDYEESRKQMSAELLREASIKHGCNFASVNLYSKSKSIKTSKWGSNHLELAILENADDKIDGYRQSAESIYKWLFTVLHVHETLHIIPDSQMREIEKGSAFTDYEYCPISATRSRPKSAKIQFVALVTTKPKVGANERLEWSVADKTGTANFYFQWRGPSSQYTWDWVLNLRVGDRKCLPRMPMIEIKERTSTAILKSPFRATAAVINGTGFVVKSAGKGLCKVGKKIKLGSRSEWVPELDVTVDAKGRMVKKSKSHVDAAIENEREVSILPVEHKSEFKIFSEKGEKLWKDDDSMASTSAGSIFNEKTTNEIV